MQKEIAQKYFDLVIVEFNQNKPTINVRKTRKFSLEALNEKREAAKPTEKSKSDFDQLPESLQAKARDLYLKELGFSRVTKLLCEARKPLIGHWLDIDLAFLFNQTLADMPNSFAEFRKVL